MSQPSLRLLVLSDSVLDLHFITLLQGFDCRECVRLKLYGLWMGYFTRTSCYLLSGGRTVPSQGWLQRSMVLLCWPHNAL